MAQDLFSDYLREWMPDRLSAASVLEWFERPDTDLSWLLVHTPLSFGASDATPNVLLRLFEHGADSEFTGHAATVPLAFFLATYPGRLVQRITPGGQAYVDRVLGVFAHQAWDLPEISSWLRNPVLKPTRRLGWSKACDRGS